MSPVASVHYIRKVGPAAVAAGSIRVRSANKLIANRRAEASIEFQFASTRPNTASNNKALVDLTC
jgi:allophanate hydrolase subunit 2